MNKTVEFIEVMQSFIADPLPAPLDPVHSFHPKCERCLPTKFIIPSAEEGPNSLELKVNIETTDTAEVKSLSSLIDSRVTREFIDWKYAKGCWFHTQKISKPIPVYTLTEHWTKLAPSLKLSTSSLGIRTDTICHHQLRQAYPWALLAM